MRSRAQLEGLELLHTQPLQHFTLSIHPLRNWYIKDALDATVKFTERPGRGERNKPRNALTSAFGAEAGLMAVSARIGGVEGKMRRIVALVAQRLPEAAPEGGCEPFRGIFCSDVVRFAQPTKAEAKGITDPVVKTKLLVAVIEHEADAFSSGTLHLWGYDAMAFAQLNSTARTRSRVAKSVRQFGESWRSRQESGADCAVERALVAHDKGRQRHAG